MILIRLYTGVVVLCVCVCINLDIEFSKPVAFIYIRLSNSI